MKTLFMPALAALLALSACEAAPRPVAPVAPRATTTAGTIGTPSSTAKALDPLAEGRAVAATFARQGDLWARFAPSMKELFGNEPAGYVAFAAKAAADLGAERDLVTERVDEDGVYHRVAHFTKIEQPIETIIAFDGAAKIAGFAVRPTGTPEAAPTTKLDYQGATKLRLPFTGTWTVFWGGKTIEQNYHASVRDQRFAYDLVVIEKGSSHRGDGKKNEDYLAYGRPILASGAGRVIAVIDGIAENVPGAMRTDAIAGNHVVIDHGNGEISYFAHLVPGSIPVHVGDVVKAGQLLGKCGNSGHSSEPHLHYHLQNSDGDGLPVQFLGYIADGKKVARGEPVRGQQIAPNK